MNKVSIVVPCYNHAEFIGDAIESILHQTYRNFEVFVFDNGSVDDSWNVINRYEDSRLKKIRLEKNNLLEVKKQFVQMATGDYFAILYSDDIWFEEKLEKQMNLLKENPSARICFTWAKQVTEDLLPATGFVDYSLNKNMNRNQWINHFIRNGNLFSCSSVIMEKDLYIRHFCRLYPYRQIADMYCWMRILQETNLYLVEEVLVYQRMHTRGFNINESARTRENLTREYLELKQVMFKILDEMNDDFFLENVLNSLEKTDHIDVLCRKFMYLKDNMEGISYSKDLAILLYEKYFDYEENNTIFYQHLEGKYGFSRNDYYDITSMEDERTKILGDKLERWEALENTDFSNISSLDKKLVLYGCGRIGKTLARKITPYVDVKAFIDKNSLLQNFEGIPIFSLDDMKLDETYLVVVVPTYDFEIIKASLLEKNKGLAPDSIISFSDFINKGDRIEKEF